jgi:hypothetical protein
MDPDDRLRSVDEHERYLLHENDPSDSLYREFLNRLAGPLIERLSPGVAGLDYGSGPGPTLSLMFEEQGYRMDNYDPYFASDETVLDRTYDFITCSETAEHFYDPRKEFGKLDRLLVRGGWLGLMTEILQDQVFEEWRYAREATHVSFYRPSTIDWIADQFRWRVERAGPNVILFQKS